MRNNSAARTASQRDRNIFSLKYIETLFELSPNSIRDKKFIVKEILLLFKKRNLIEVLVEKKINQYFKSILQNIYKSKYITYKDKISIKNNSPF